MVFNYNSLAFCSDPNKSFWTNDNLMNLEMLQKKLKYGNPSDKEEVLLLYMENQILELTPNIISALLDPTRLPRHEDTGWATVHHLAANTLCNVAEKLDGKNQKERGWDKYTFYEDGGVGNTEKRNQVFNNWKKWWEENQKYIVYGIYTSYLWPGEGIPIFQTEKPELIMHTLPNALSPSVKINWEIGTLLSFDQSRYITTRAITLKIPNDMTNLTCSHGRTKLNQGDTIEYLQYRAEGFGIVRMGQEICEVFIGNMSGNKEPETEWWIRIRDKDQNQVGWLQVYSNSVKIIKRNF